MSDETDGHVINLARPKLGIRDMLKAASPPPPAAVPVLPAAKAEPEGLPAMDQLPPLPRPGDPYTAAYGRADHKALLTLHVLMADGSIEGFAYSDLRRIRLLPSNDPGKGPELVLRFVEAETSDVRIASRILDVYTLHDLVGHHRIPWIRALPAGKIVGDKEAVITGMVIDPVEG